MLAEDAVVYMRRIPDPRWAMALPSLPPQDIIVCCKVMIS